MWGFTEPLLWEPWPAGPRPPEIRAALSLAQEPVLAVLVGSAAAGARGRFGIVGIPASWQILEAGVEALVSAIDRRRHGTLRVVALGYELGAPVVFLPPAHPPRGQPLGLALDLPSALIVDHATSRMAIVGGDRTARQQLRDACLAASPTAPGARAEGSRGTGAAYLRPTVSDAEHARRIARAREHIAAGEIYQVNLTRRLTVHGSIDGAVALAALHACNPVAHSAQVRVPGVEIVSNSMETLLTFEPRARIACSYPIKGTCRRDPVPQRDRALAERLRRDAKECAEHVMIVDLVRNDLGKVAEPGSVCVPCLMQVEGYRGVWHGVSCVQGRLDQSQTAGRLAAAVFPGGSITGAPKRRAMQTISDLEQEPRGFYTGSLGIVAPDGTLSMSILIRTLVRDGEGWSLSVGGGIVTDSVAAREIAETWEKVSVFEETLAGDGYATPSMVSNTDTRLDSSTGR